MLLTRRKSGAPVRQSSAAASLGSGALQLLWEWQSATGLEATCMTTVKVDFLFKCDCITLHSQKMALRLLLLQNQVTYSVACPAQGDLCHDITIMAAETSERCYQYVTQLMIFYY